ncbi:MAG: ATP-binding protein [Thaumarchaeota archaeon]|jgi:hypothetical protein|nr:ATP-binding protein [Candidatus Geocrenenecus arthurdayi]
MVAERSFDVILVGEPLERVACGKLLEFLQTAWESPAIEFKTWSGERSGGYEEDSKSVILRSVSAFLNSSEGRGLLVIGVRGKERFEGVECIPRDEKFRSREAVEAFIRETIFSHIKALPDYRVPPLLKVKVFSCKEDCGLDQDGWLATIYVERRADSLYYYSIGGKDRAYIREGSRSRELRIDEMLQLIERKRRAIIVTILNPHIINDHTIELEALARNIGSKPAMYLHTRLAIIKDNINASLPQGTSKVYVESVTYDGVLSKVRENQDSTVFSFTSNPAWITHPVIFPYLDVGVGRVRLNLRSSLPDNVVKVLIPFESLTFTEDTVTYQLCVAVVTKSDVDEECNTIVKDYLGVSVLQERSLKLKVRLTLGDIMRFQSI